MKRACVVLCAVFIIGTIPTSYGAVVSQVRPLSITQAYVLLGIFTAMGKNLSELTDGYNVLIEDWYTNKAENKGAKGKLSCTRSFHAVPHSFSNASQELEDLTKKYAQLTEQEAKYKEACAGKIEAFIVLSDLTRSIMYGLVEYEQNIKKLEEASFPPDQLRVFRLNQQWLNIKFTIFLLEITIFGYEWALLLKELQQIQDDFDKKTACTAFDGGVSGAVSSYIAPSM